MVKGAEKMFNEDFMRMLELSQGGFYCSQILLALGLEKQGKENPDLIRAMDAIAGGLGFTGKNCGALTGGACLLGLYAGRGSTEDPLDSRLYTMIEQLVTWFEEKYGAMYGGIDCSHIIGDDAKNRSQRCPQIVRETYVKVLEILQENGFDPEG